MWSLGCVIAELFLGWPLYPGASEYDQVGMDTALDAGKCMDVSPIFCQHEQIPTSSVLLTGGNVFLTLPSQLFHYPPGVLILGNQCAL